MTDTSVTREEWLLAVAIELDEWFIAKAGVTCLTGESEPNFRVSVGWPRGSRGPTAAKTLGICYASSSVKDGKPAIYISPILDDSLTVAETLAHELSHSIAGHTCGHKGEFQRIARAIGLDGPLTATKAGPDLRSELARIIRYIGVDYAALHSPQNVSESRKKQGTRMLKATCGAADVPRCDFTARVTASHSDSVAHYCANAEGNCRPCHVQSANTQDSEEN